MFVMLVVAKPARSAAPSPLKSATNSCAQLLGVDQVNTESPVENEFTPLDTPANQTPIPTSIIVVASTKSKWLFLAKPIMSALPSPLSPPTKTFAQHGPDVH